MIRSILKHSRDITWLTAIGIFAGLFCLACEEINPTEANLYSIAAAQEEYFHSNHRYADGFGPLDCQLIGDGISYYCGDEVIHNGKGEGKVSCRIGERLTVPSGKASGDWPLRLRPTASSTGFVCLAMNDVEHAVYPMVISVNQTMKISYLVENGEDPGHLIIKQPSFRVRVRRAVDPYIIPGIFLLLVTIFFTVLITQHQRMIRKRGERAAAPAVPPPAP